MRRHPRSGAPRLRRVWVDQGYKQHFVDWAQGVRDWVIEAVARPKDAKGLGAAAAGWSGPSPGWGAAGG